MTDEMPVVDVSRTKREEGGIDDDDVDDDENVLAHMCFTYCTHQPASQQRTRTQRYKKIYV